MKDNNLYMEVRNWIYRNARPLDLVRWQYHYENGKVEEVIKVLSEYQNKDGGFGHALEADCWNPNSSPIQTFRAIELLKEINFTEKDHPIVKGIIRYLDSGIDFEKKAWNNTILSNNDYPHAPWWHSNSDGSSHNKYNPTAGLAGFVLCYADRNSQLYQTGAEIAVEAVDCLLQASELDMHVLLCYNALMEFCEQSDITELFSLKDFKQKLISLVSSNITKDTSIWLTSYICKPSHFFNSPESIFYNENKEIADYECEFIKKARNNEGVWDITWSWEAYPEEWAISKNWWKSNVAICNLIYLRNFDKLN